MPSPLSLRPAAPREAPFAPGVPADTMTDEKNQSDVSSVTLRSILTILPIFPGGDPFDSPEDNSSEVLSPP